ncbi:MAG TPA: helix-turn-helix domain-containing protein [Candidatus Hydrogenedentes bacterium]|nr:helix-turn-helix domain-containing protein [Candidatus Hydrogenedentota bacterium]HPG68543.1 helix-turn-helix domain-containing protein [Candidatus Hydrogenedentota bacterium]
MKNAHYPGDELRDRREALGLSTEDVFLELSIPRAYVEALEGGNFDALPASCYALAFLRTYCTFLGLAPERFLDSFRACAGTTPRVVPAVAEKRKARLVVLKEELLTWATIFAILLLGWVTYALVLWPKSNIEEGRVEADTIEMVVPPSSYDGDR